MTKTFTAKQLHHAPAQVFRAADKQEDVVITHDHYKDRVFKLTAEDKNPPLDECKHDCDGNMICKLCGEQCFRFHAYIPPINNGVINE